MDSDKIKREVLLHEICCAMLWPQLHDCGVSSGLSSYSSLFVVETNIKNVHLSNHIYTTVRMNTKNMNLNMPKIDSTMLRMFFRPSLHFCPRREWNWKTSRPQIGLKKHKNTRGIWHVRPMGREAKELSDTLRMEEDARKGQKTLRKWQKFNGVFSQRRRSKKKDGG